MVAAAIMLSACGGGAKDFIADNYSKTSQDGDVVLYSSKDPVGTTVSRIVDADEPAARSADGGNEYLRYDDDIVTVSSASSGGSTIKVEDIDGTYRSGGYAYLGRVSTRDPRRVEAAAAAVRVAPNDGNAQ